jgi:hypothetical protein
MYILSKAGRNQRKTVGGLRMIFLLQDLQRQLRASGAASLFHAGKPAAKFDQTAQIFDLAGVARVAVDDAGETNAKRWQRRVLRLVEDMV